MQFRVVIPEHVKAGQTIRIHCPDGTEANVKVPDGLCTGDSFIFEMAVDQLKDPQALLDSLRQKNPKSVANAKDSGATTKKKGFLDREILNLQDFVMALSVGLVIGLGIVLGFLLGILYVTDDITSMHDTLPKPVDPQRQWKQQVPQEQLQLHTTTAHSGQSNSPHVKASFHTSVNSKMMPPVSTEDANKIQQEQQEQEKFHASLNGALVEASTHASNKVMPRISAEDATKIHQQLQEKLQAKLTGTVRFKEPAN
jgi:hypothetical protein